LEPAEKRATVYTYPDLPKDKTPQRDPVAGWRSLLLDARNNRGRKRESLGAKDIDGRHVVGVRITFPGEVMSIWGDPQTGAPVRIESTDAFTHGKVTISNFVFNVPLDEALFSVEPPAGYEVTRIQVHVSNSSPFKEKDLIDLFRYYSACNGGRFPELLDMRWLNSVVCQEKWLANNLEAVHKRIEQVHQPLATRIEQWFAATLEQAQKAMAKPQKPTAKPQEELDESPATIERGLMFTVRLPEEADAHYAGRGVSRGAAGTPVFWYRPQATQPYRVIYADLSVREAVTPPRVPVVPVAQLEKDLIEMFRQYCDLSGGPFPDALDMRLTVALAVKYASFIFKPQKPSAQQEQEIAEALVKLERGLIFTGLLPKDADAHYAGQGVARGAAGKPIFWYRPQDAKQYRVIYADLSVREAGTPPSVPQAQPVPAKSPAPSPQSPAPGPQPQVPGPSGAKKPPAPSPFSPKK